MKHLSFLFVTIYCINTVTAQTAGYLKKDDGSSGSVNCYNLYEDGNGNTGIGTLAPNANLQINHSSSGGTSTDFLSVTQTTVSGSFPNFTYTPHSKFVVKADGNVGIGIADPLALLHISSDKTLSALDQDMFNQVKVVGTNADGDPFFIISDMSYLNGSTHQPAGFMGVISSDDVFSFGVLNFNNNSVALGAQGNGTVVVNMGLADEPIAQVDVRPRAGVGNVLNIGDDGSTPLLRLNEVAHLGIGIAPQGGSTLALYDANGDTRIDLTASSGHTKAIRFMGSSTSTPRHVITEISGDLVIDPGVASGGGNDLLKVDGKTFITAETGIGLAPTASALSVKGTSDTKFDLIETSTTVDYNAQLRFIANDGTTVRHLITENSTGELLIKPGYDGGALATVKTEGDVKVTGVADIDGRVKIGNVTIPNSDYMLFVEKGILAERVRCAVKTTSSWSDFVFNKDYELMSIYNLEKYVIKNHHLPNIPSADEVCANGIDLAEINARLLEKIEELSLYMITLQKQIDQLKVSKQR